MIMGILTAVLIVIFSAIIGWAYSGRRKNEFEAMARVPLDDISAEHKQ